MPFNKRDYHPKWSLTFGIIGSRFSLLNKNYIRNWKRIDMVDNLSNVHEWGLAIKFKSALSIEDYETCSIIQKELNRRILAGTINKQLLEGFKFYNPDTENFEGEYNVDGLNGLFDNILNI